VIVFSAGCSGPSATARPAAAPPPESDVAVEAPVAVDDSSVYAVSEDDTVGFWGIAYKVYGAGRHWQVIADANPDVDPADLQPGTRLVIPPKPAETGPTKAVRLQPIEATDTTATTDTATTGARTYTVTETDTTGLWGIAKKVYGSGTHHTLIRQANPGVDSRHLKPGDRLVIPPKPPR
jgi:nucleoid-associated protein YgaU